jgi:hypothetical protein
MELVGQTSSGENLGDLVGPLLTLAILICAYWIMFRGFRWRDPDRARRAGLGMRTVTGSNVGIILATFAIAQFAFEFDLLRGFDLMSIGALFLLVVVIVLVSASALAERIVDLVAITAFIIVVYTREGSAAGLTYLVIAVFLLIVLSATRFLVPGRR